MKKISILFLVILMAGVSVGCVKNGKQTAKENKETGEKTNYGKAITKSSNNRNKQIAQIQKLQ